MGLYGTHRIRVYITKAGDQRSVTLRRRSDGEPPGKVEVVFLWFTHILSARRASRGLKL